MLKKALRQHFRQSCTEQDLHQWFDPLEILLADEKRLEVRFPHPFFAQWFSIQVQDRFEAELNLYMGDGYTVDYSIRCGRMAPTSPTPPPAISKKLTAPYGREYTFETFISNKRNFFPVASAREVARRDEEIRYNPFVICGPAGSGKTHLLRAIANDLSKTVDKKYIYLGTVDDLGTLATSSLPLSTRKALENCRYLLIDDLHRLRELPQMQEELTSLFNSFYDSRKQMVFTCPGKLAELDFMDAGLRSRLEWGLIVTLKSPDLEVLVKFIQRQCKLYKLQLNKEHIFTLAQRFRDFRHLQGVLNRLTAYRDLVNRAISDSDFEQVLSHTEARAGRPLSADRILALCAGHFSLPVKDITGDKRHQKVVLARQIAMFLCRELMGSSYPALGRIFGGKDHSTAMYAVKKIQKMIDSDRTTKQLVTDLKKQCLSGSE
ncbi:DnaA ATPase domain-containing protein [Oleidesulfovibrio sp.]|uniref:DnaA ATPase domain-containing protein n=1 Tax=Oleidesulfovibrio sp. TaxID=2909707 RepID=UPI003A86074E